MKDHATKFCRGFALLPAVGLVLLLASCGSSSKSNQNNNTSYTGPQSITNGGTLASATSHWVAQNPAGCIGNSSIGGIEVELTQNDSGFKTYLAYVAGGDWYQCTGTWVQKGDQYSAMMNGPQCTCHAPGEPDCNAYVSMLENIAGTTSSSTFTSGVNLDVHEVNSSSAGSCAFNLANGPL
jgi:hypothetical protein